MTSEISQQTTARDEPSSRLLFITNFCPHYRVKTFETLASVIPTDFLFFSDGSENYWDPRHGLQTGRFRGRYLRGFRILGVRITPELMSRILFGQYDVMMKCVTGRFALPITYMLAAIKRRPFILWTNLWYHPETAFHRFSRPLLHWIYTHADAVVAAGTHVGEFLRRQGVNEERLFVSSHAVDPALFARTVVPAEIEELRHSLGLAHDRVVLYVGRFDPIKGLEYLVEGFRLVADLEARLLLVGDGKERERLKALVARHDLSEKVIFKGYVPNHLLPTFYALATVLVLPSITLHGVKEVWGQVINEGMYQGCPVIATDAVGAAAGGLVRNNVTGYVVPEKNAEQIAAALRKILSDIGLEQQMRSNTRAEIGGWTYERQVEPFLAAFRYVRDRAP